MSYDGDLHKICGHDPPKFSKSNILFIILIRHSFIRPLIYETGRYHEASEEKLQKQLRALQGEVADLRSAQARDRVPAPARDSRPARPELGLFQGQKRFRFQIRARESFFYADFSDALLLLLL